MSAAFFPLSVGHSLGLGVRDVPSASKLAVNNTIGKGTDLVSNRSEGYVSSAVIYQSSRYARGYIDHGTRITDRKFVEFGVEIRCEKHT